jgi:hypothetical protein
VKKILTILVVVLFSVFSYATDIYVSELFGSDETGDGSEGNPYATIQKGVDQAGPGDIIIVDFGTYIETVTPLVKGTDGNPIVIMSKEAGEAEITTGEAYDLPTFSLQDGFIYETSDVFRRVSSVTENGAALTAKVAYDSLVAGSWFQNRGTNQLFVWSGDSADPATHTDSVFYSALSFDIVEGSYLTIDGFDIKNGIRAEVTDNEVPLPGLKIVRNIFSGEFASTALYIDGGAADSNNTYENFLIKDNIFENAVVTRIYNAGRNSRIVANSFLGDTEMGPDVGADLIRLEGNNDFSGVQCDGIIFEQNLFANGNNGRYMYVRNGDLDDITIRNNIFYKGWFTALDFNAPTNVDLINNTFVRQGDSHPMRMRANTTGRVYNNILAYTLRAYALFFDNSGEESFAWELDYNYYVNDTSLANTREDEMVRARVPINSSSYTGGPHAVYGHPMRAWQDTIFTTTGDTIVIDPERVTLWGDTVAVDSIPDIWDSDAYPLFADTSAGTPEGLMLVAGSNAINAGYNDVAPEFDFFGNSRTDGKVDIGAIEFGAINSLPDKVNAKTPEGFALFQNYPNPFNPTTSFTYQLPEATDISLKIFNILGQKIATIYNGQQKMGTHIATWDGKNDSGIAMSTGVYILTLETGSVQKSIKMLLLK